MKKLFLVLVLLVSLVSSYATMAYEFNFHLSKLEFHENVVSVGGSGEHGLQCNVTVYTESGSVQVAIQSMAFGGNVSYYILTYTAEDTVLAAVLSCNGESISSVGTIPTGNSDDTVVVAPPPGFADGRVLLEESSEIAVYRTGNALHIMALRPDGEHVSLGVVPNICTFSDRTFIFEDENVIFDNSAWSLIVVTKERGDIHFILDQWEMVNSGKDVGMYEVYETPCHDTEEQN